MSRWMIEKSGTGIEKSGTGIEKSGTGIEKSGTGIEKSGTGIEKSGTGIRSAIIACGLAAATFVSSAGAGNIRAEGTLQLVVDRNTIAATWILGDSIHAGVATANGSFARLALTETTIASDTDVGGTGSGVEVGGTGSGLEVGGTGSGIEVGGTGSGIQVGGTGSGIQVGGTGSGIQVGGTGSGIQVGGTGSGIHVGGTGSGIQVGGTGSGVHVGGTGSGIHVGGTGSGLKVGGTGSGSESIVISGSELMMEITLGCGSADVTIVDSELAPVISFSKVPVIGGNKFCAAPSTRLGRLQR